MKLSRIEIGRISSPEVGLFTLKDGGLGPVVRAVLWVEPGSWRCWGRGLATKVTQWGLQTEHPVVL